MNEEIIIDGVNVAGCKNYISIYTEDTDVEVNNCCTLTYTPCQFEKKDCYFKQLKHLEKENNQLVTKCSQLEKENEKLKRTSTEIIFNIRKESYQYYKTLEEIREIAYELYDAEKECNSGSYKILKIINKVLGSEEK